MSYNYTCPNCNEDLDEWFDKNNPCSCYGGKFNCPKCNKILECEYDESWDGEDETQYYWLSISKENKK